MIELIPSEYWEYSIYDGFRGLAIAMAPFPKFPSITLKGIGECIPARSARAAIVTALKALDLPSKSSVAVPLYCCPVVFKAIATAGFSPRFIDMDPDNYCLSTDDLSKKLSSVEAIIAVHMFGHTSDMSRILDTAKGKPVIEDCAQSIGSTLQGKMTGSFGDIAAFSFRSGKYLSVGEGGALFSGKSSLFSRLAERTAALPAPRRFNEARHIAETFLRTALRRKPLWGVVGTHIWNRYNKTVGYSNQSPLILERTYRTDLQLIRRRLQYLENSISMQRANAEHYSRALALDPGMLPFEKPGTFLNRYLYPILFSSPSERDFVADYLLKRRIGSIKPYQTIAELAATHYGYSGDCPIAENRSKRLLAIPVHHGLKKSEVKHIASCVNSAWNEVRKSV